jgi:hypothetical protein
VRILKLLTVSLACLLGVTTGPLASQGSGSDLAFDPGTPADRAVLFDFLVESTMEWDAFASLPDHPYYQAHPKGINVREKMYRYRDELIAADTDEKLWYALWKISNARKDTHLRVVQTDGGLVVPDSLQRHVHAPVHVSRSITAISMTASSSSPTSAATSPAAGRWPPPALGDRVVRINGREAECVRRSHPPLLSLLHREQLLVAARQRPEPHPRLRSARRVSR